jgi:leader peptidase (prepilin peptidase)/N-methyltransferase
LTGIQCVIELTLLVLAVVFGAVVGSFLNVVILRLPQDDESIAFPGSHCPHCNQPLHWYDNIPLLSYLVLRGKCRTCRASISLQYPLVELSMAILAGMLFHRFAGSFEFFFYFTFFAALLVIIFIDIHHQVIPDCISLPGILLGLAGSFFNGLVTWQQSALGIFLGGGVLYAVAYFYYALTKREGMGGGDIKLLAMIGAFLGWQSLLYVVFASSLVGSIVGVAAMIKQRKGGQTRIPFGPFLALGAISYLLLSRQITEIWHLYLQASGL